MKLFILALFLISSLCINPLFAQQDTAAERAVETYDSIPEVELLITKTFNSLTDKLRIPEVRDSLSNTFYRTYSEYINLGWSKDKVLKELTAGIHNLSDEINNEFQLQYDAPQNFEIRNVQTSYLGNEEPFLVFQAEAYNISDVERILPNLRAVLLDENGEELAAASTSPKFRKLNPGEYGVFENRLKIVSGSVKFEVSLELAIIE